MSQRVAKVESLIQQVAATNLVELLDADSASVTVTRVDASPDLRSATIWIGLLGSESEQDRLWAHLEHERSDLQAAVARAMKTKFVPKLFLKRDTGGEYAAEIDRLLRDLQ